MWIVLDLVVVAIIAIIALISAKKGFVRTIVEIVGFIAVILMANNVSPMLSETTYDKFIQPAIVNSIEEIHIEEQLKDTSINEISTENIPQFITKLLGDDFEIENFIANINENINNGVTEAVTEASQNVIKPIVTEILTLVYMLFIVLVSLVVVKFAAKVINKLFSFSLVGKANKMLGAILGIIKGIAVAVILCSLFTLIVSLIPDANGILSETTIESTILFKLFSFSI